MKQFYKSSNSLLLLAIVFAITTSWLLPKPIFALAHIIADVAMKLLKLISLPVISFSILSTISGMGDWYHLKSLGKITIALTLITTILAATVTFGLYQILHPAMKSSLIPPTDSTFEPMKTNYMDQLLNIIPSNILQPFVEHNVMGVLLIAMLFGLAILSLPDHKKQPVHQFLEGIFSAIMQIVRWLVKLMPVAVWAFITILVEDFQKGFFFNQLFYYLLVVVGANLLQAFIVLPSILKFHRIPVIKTAKGMFQALTFAFFSKSSAATMPIAIECAEKLGIQPRVARFTFPLCTTINMNGCAAFIFATVLFVSESNGIHFTLFEQIGWIFIATIAAVGNAGVPMGCFFLSSALLSTMNVPITLMGLIIPFYSLIDMLETAINIWSDSCVTMAVDQKVKEHFASPPDKFSLR